MYRSSLKELVLAQAALGLNQVSDVSESRSPAESVKTKSFCPIQ
jgi:hypothetical protein